MEELNNEFKGKVLATLWKSMAREKALQFVAVKDVRWIQRPASKISR
jgi:hypothetical protein